MSRIKGKDTQPELIIRSLLHKAGFRYRIHASELPGKPDIVLKKYNAVIFINGCFWHRHDCKYFKWPKSNSVFWKEKIQKNVLNDEENMEKLTQMKWRICIIWECALKTSSEIIAKKVNVIESWLCGDSMLLEVKG